MPRPPQHFVVGVKGRIVMSMLLAASPLVLRPEERLERPGRRTPPAVNLWGVRVGVGSLPHACLPLARTGVRRSGIFAGSSMAHGLAPRWRRRQGRSCGDSASAIMWADGLAEVWPWVSVRLTGVVALVHD